MGLTPLSRPSMYTKDVLAKTGISRDALRHYNEIGLVTPSINPHNKYKQYTDADVEVLCFVKQAQKIGFTLLEIREIATHMRSATCKHQSLIPYLEGQLDEINERITTLQKMKRHITHLIKDFEKRNCAIAPTDFTM